MTRKLDNRFKSAPFLNHKKNWNNNKLATLRRQPKHAKTLQKQQAIGKLRNKIIHFYFLQGLHTLTNDKIHSSIFLEGFYKYIVFPMTVLKTWENRETMLRKHYFQ